MNNPLLQTEAGKVISGLGISTGVAVFILGVGVAFFAYGKYLDSKLTKLKIMQAEKELGLEHNGVLGDLSQTIGLNKL
jgi:hypothetical protein